MKLCNTNHWVLAFATISVACGGAQVDLIKIHSAEIVILQSDTHELLGVKVFQDDQDLVIYGRIKKTGGFCQTPGQVDVAIIGTDGSRLSAFGIPIEDRGKKRRGWHGANYRARVPLVLPRGAKIRLAFHGDNCHPEPVFDVPENLAI